MSAAVGALRQVVPVQIDRLMQSTRPQQLEAMQLKRFPGHGALRLDRFGALVGRKGLVPSTLQSESAAQERPGPGVVVTVNRERALRDGLATGRIVQVEPAGSDLPQAIDTI